MRKLENIFKTRFQNKQSNEGIDADELWAVVEENLEKEIIRDSWGLKRWGLLFLFVLMIGLSYYYSSIDVNTIDINEVEAIVEDKEFSKEAAQSSIEHRDTEAQNDLFAENKPSENEHLLTELARSEASTGFSNDKIRTNNTNNLTHNNSRNKLDSNTFIYQNNRTENLFHKPLLEESLNKNPSTQVIELLPSLQLFINSTSAITSKWPVITTNKVPEPKRKSNKLPLEIGIYSGINTVNTRYKNSGDNTAFLDELTRTTSKNIGTVTSLSVSYLFNDQISMSSGIDYETTQSLFEQVSEKDSNIWVNRLISYELAPTSGDTINSIYADELLDALATRTVKHRNQFKTISIPLSFGLRKQLGKVGLGINLGMSYNFFLSQKGRTLNAQGDIYTFNGSNATSVPFKKSFFAIQVNPFVDFKIGGHLKLRINPVLKYQSQGNSSLYGLKQNSVLMGLNGGIVFGF